MNLLVGAPVLLRQWVIGPWFDHVEEAARIAGIDVSYLFVGGDSDPTWDVVRARTDAGTDVEVVHVAEPRAVDSREGGWTAPGRLERMVELRNILLRAVRDWSPGLFLSLDSDILLHPDTIACLIEDLGRFPAVGACCYMSAPPRDPSRRAAETYPSNLVRTPSGGWYRRKAQNNVIPVDVIMAAKLMTRPAYAVDYRYHHWGEDVGWSLAARAAGVRLGWDARTVSKHVMHPWMLDQVDPRVGF